MTDATDELPAWMLEEDDNSNTSWAAMDVNDCATGNYTNEICQIRGTTTRGLPGILNGYYGIIKGQKNGHFVVDMPQHHKFVLIHPKNVLVQTIVSQRVALMLPDGRFLRPVLPN